MHGERIGVYASLTVRVDTRATKRYVGSLASNFDLPVDAEDWHVTMLDYDETAVRVRSPRDEHALDRTRNEVGVFLSGVTLSGIVLHPDTSRRRLERFGSYLGVPITVTPELTLVRSAILDIAHENLRDNRESNKWDPHISVVHWRGGRKGLQPARIGPHAPRDLYVKGFIVGQGAVAPGRDNSATARRKQPYANRSTPLGTRH